MDSLQQLDPFFKKHPHIRFVTPDSPNYIELRSTFFGTEGATPLGIARPQTAEDVAAIVAFVVAKSIPFTVRSGGHDSFHRGFAADALCIDMRDIDYVNIDASKTSARVGGGVLQGKIGKDLAKEKLTTSMASVPSVGYVGWAVCGGYGRFPGTYGLGLDQILAAKLVNSHGKIVDADADMMRIIRGGGGMLGVIVELTIKVYHLDKIFAGFLAFETADLAATIKQFAAGYRALDKEGFPAPLHMLPVITNGPAGKMLGVSFTWSSPDFATGRRFLDLVSSWGGNVAFNGVQETTIPDWQEASVAHLPRQMFGIYNQKSCRVFELTEEVADVIAAAAQKMPNDPATLTGFHSLRNAEEPIQDSVFGVRRPHLLIEMLSTVSEPDPGKLEEAKQWCIEYVEALKKTNPANLEPAQYFTHTSPEDANFPEMYGQNWDAMLAAKQMYDPKNIFRMGPTFPPIATN